MEQKGRQEVFVERLARWWSVNDPLPETADLIVPVSHGATRIKPTRGAVAVTTKTRQLSHRYPAAKLAFGIFTGSAYQYIEKEFKRSMLSPDTIFVGLVISTIEECLKVKNSLPDGFDPGIIIVVTDEAHSRRCKIVWKTFFPKSDIRIVAVPILSTTDKDSPMWPYRYTWPTLFFQALPTPIFWWWCRKGPQYLATKATGYHQPTTK